MAIIFYVPFTPLVIKEIYGKGTIDLLTTAFSTKNQLLLCWLVQKWVSVCNIKQWSWSVAIFCSANHSYWLDEATKSLSITADVPQGDTLWIRHHSCYITFRIIPSTQVCTWQQADFLYLSSKLYSLRTTKRCDQF